MCRRRNFAADAVTSDITLYAKWTEASTGNKEIKFEGIEKVEIPEGAIELSEDEKAAIAAGRTVYIIVKAKEQEPSSEEVKKAIEEKAKERIEEYGAISFYDISVYTQIEGELDRRDVHDTKGEITITMKRPSNMDYEKFFIVRNHNDIMDTLDCVYDRSLGAIRFKTTKFSDYAFVGYEDGNDDDDDDSEEEPVQYVDHDTYKSEAPGGTIIVKDLLDANGMVYDLKVHPMEERSMTNQKLLAAAVYCANAKVICQKSIYVGVIYGMEGSFRNLIWKIDGIKGPADELKGYSGPVSAVCYNPTDGVYYVDGICISAHLISKSYLLSSPSCLFSSAISASFLAKAEAISASFSAKVLSFSAKAVSFSAILSSSECT